MGSAMEGSSRVPHPQHVHSTPERQIRDARTRVWTFVFRCWHSKKGAHDVVTVTTNKPSNTENGITNNGTGGT
jgi:hypothetical protein